LIKNLLKLESSQTSWRDEFKVHRFLLNHSNSAVKPVGNPTEPSENPQKHHKQQNCKLSDSPLQIYSPQGEMVAQGLPIRVESLQLGG
jgi:hypothetical protein